MVINRSNKSAGLCHRAMLRRVSSAIFSGVSGNLINANFYTNCGLVGQCAILNSGFDVSTREQLNI